MAELTVPSNGHGTKLHKQKFTRYRDRLLPISSSQLQDTAQAEWSAIERRLCRVLSDGDLIYELPEVLGAVMRYIHCHGLRMPKSQRIALLKLTLSMVCCPNLDPSIAFQMMNLSRQLMKYRKTLSTKSLQLDWRRFYDMLQWLTVTAEARLDLLQWPRHEVENFFAIIRSAKRFFPLSCIEEIWSEFRHQILERMLSGVGQHTFDLLHVLMPFFPKSFDQISRTWLPDVIDLWYINTDFGKPFHDVVGVLAHVARFCRGRVDWEPHLERVFCGLLRAITLPHGPVTMDDTPGMHTKPSMVDPYAELLANAIGPERTGEKSTVIQRLKEFYKTVQPFYHPSNPGVSTALLVSFTQHFVSCLSARLLDELMPSFEQAEELGLSPAEFNLTVEQVDEVVNLILPIVLDHMLFCKLERILIKVVQTIDVLARLRPRLVLPALLTRLEEGLDRSESPLRYTRPLYALCFCVASLSHVRFPLFRRSRHLNARVGEDSGTDVEESDEESEEKQDANPVHENCSGHMNGYLDDDLKSGLNVDSVNSSLGHQVAKHLALLSPHGQAHLKALTYPEGRTELVRLMNLLLSGFDLNHADRVYLTVACLSRLFLATPIQDFSELPSNELTSDLELDDHTRTLAKSIASSTADLEELAVRVFQRILDCLLALSDRSAVGQNVTSAGPSVQTSTTDGSVLRRPHAGPEGRPRVASEVSQLSGLAGLSVALAISAGPAPHLRRRLIRLLVDAAFASQWEPDTARLLAYQLYWLSVKSKCSVASQMNADEFEDAINLCDTDMFAIDCIWPRFCALYRELHTDGSIVYRGRAEPRLLAMLYILSGPFAAIHPSRLVEPEFGQLYLHPLVAILSELLFLSAGVSADASQPCKRSTFTNSTNSESTGACPALAEAASSLLAVILYRLTNCTIDLSNVDFMQSGSKNAVPSNLFLTSPWWTPFLSMRSLFEQSSSSQDDQIQPIEADSDNVASFWVIPSAETRSFADQLLHQFLGPILSRLDQINDQLSVHQSGFSVDLTIADQRNQLSSLLIWTNHLLMSVANVLSPRVADGDDIHQVPPPPWHGHRHLTSDQTDKRSGDFVIESTLNWSYFSCTFTNSKGEQVGLRDFIFELGLRFLITIADLFVQADDSLSGTGLSNGNGTLAQTEDSQDSKSKLFFGTADSKYDVSLLFNSSQLNDLIRVTFCGAFNWAMDDQAPSMLLPVRGPQALCDPDLGARSCLTPHGNSNSSEPIPTLKLIPTLRSLIGVPCQQHSWMDLDRPGSNRTDVGRSALSWIAFSQKCHWLLSARHLRYSLNRLAALQDPDWAWCHNIAPSPAVEQLIRVMGCLSTAPRRADIRRCATNYLVNFAFIVVPGATTDIVLSAINRLNNAEDDVKAEAARSLCSDSSESHHSELMFKLVQHRCRSAILLLSQIHQRVQTMRQHDEFIRLDPTVMAKLWIAIIAQAMHRSTTDLEETGQSRLSPAEIRYRQTAQDQLEHLVFDAFGHTTRLSLGLTLDFPTKMDDLIVDGGWLHHVYQQVNHLLKVFQPGSCTTCTLKPNSPVLRVIAKRRSVYKQFLADVFNCCLSTYQNHITNSNQQKSVAGQALVARILNLLPRPINPPLNPSWKPNCVQLALPPPAPPVTLLQIACNLITSQQPDVAHSACTYLTDTLYILSLRHGIAPRIELDAAACAKQRTGADPPVSGPPLPLPRADNLFLLFDEHARVLATDEAFHGHHHIPPWDLGYIYFPPKVIIEDPKHKLKYPVFDETTGLLDQSQSDWLNHFDATDSEQREVRECMSYLAETLASPRDETRQFWLLLGQRVLRLHRNPTRRELFPVNLFVQACLLAFGPDPLIHHLEAFIRFMLLVQPGGQGKFDGITEVVAPCWGLLTTLSMTSSSRRWPRPWRYYYIGRMLPRLLAMLELNALTVSTNGLTQTASSGQIHPELTRLFFVPLRYAGSYSGLGSFAHPDTADDNQDALPISNPGPTAASNSKPVRPSTDPMTTVAQTQAGGPITRMAFAWDLLFCWLTESGEFDVSLLHPLWDWTQEGIKECELELHGISNAVDGHCSHNRDAALPCKCVKSVDDECPVCLLQRCLPIAHRRVFYARMCTTLVTYMGWKGIRLHGYLSNCLPTDCPNDSELKGSAWFRQAADDSVWIRDTAAKIAVYRACLPHTDVFHGRRIPLRLRSGTSITDSSSWRMAEAQLSERERFLISLLATNQSKEFLGAQFVTEMFLPHLVRDTIAALRLKGYEPSAASLALRCAPPEQLSTTRSSPFGDLSFMLPERDKWIELTPLANRLRCMYACLPSMLAHAFPVSLRPSNTASEFEQNRVSALQFCHMLMPLLADLCSIGNLYRTISHVLSMGTFGSAGFARTANDGTGDEVLDGLESGVAIVLRRFALIPLAGQGDPQTAISACLDLTRPLLVHTSWKARGVGLLLLRNLVVVNLPAFWTTRGMPGNPSPFHAVVKSLQQTLSTHLADQWIEVRQLAMCTLAVFIQVGLIDFDSQWVDQLMHQARTRYPRNLGPEAQGTPLMAEYHKAIRERHAGILGLAAFVHAHPHTTPDYLPQIITELAGHVHDPQPIGKTVSDTLAAYSRNHQDNWHEHRHKFTEEQLEEYLSVVSAAAYYV